MRMLIAGCIAVLAFLLPQELPLEWYPLNEPGDDVNLLQITFAARTDGEVSLLYDTGQGFNEAGTIRIPVSSQARLPYTYTFPLPDAPLQALRLHPLPGGGAMEIWDLRILNRAGREIRRFNREHAAPLGGIAAVTPVAEGWTITSAPEARDPAVQLRMDAPEIPAGMNARNLQRCLRSTGYVAGMLGLILLTAFAIIERPTAWRAIAAPFAFLALLSLLFAVVANRGLIRNSIRHANFPIVPGADHLCLEMEVATNTPTTAQLYWDSGNGFDEALSIKAFYANHTGLQTLRFRLPRKPIRQLRFDPLVNEGRLEIRSLRLVDDAHRTVSVLPMDGLLPENEISLLEERAGRLLLQIAPGCSDPTTRFSPTSLEIINDHLDRLKRTAAAQTTATSASAKPDAPAASTTCTMINVTPATWQADCFLIETADGRRILMDAADAAHAPPSFMPFMQQQRIRKIDLVVISHFHRDHYGRLRDLVEAGVAINRVSVNLPASRELADKERSWGMDWDEVQGLLRFLDDMGIACFTPKAGDILMECRTDDGLLTRLEAICLFNGIDTPIGTTSINDTSMLLRFSHGPTRMLFTGDLDRPLGTWLASSQHDLRADILKAPHHGGEPHPPNEFYDRVAPQVILISTSKELWTSARCARMRTYVADRHLAHHVTGIDGSTVVRFTPEGFSITTDQNPKGIGYTARSH